MALASTLHLYPHSRYHKWWSRVMKIVYASTDSIHHKTKEIIEEELRCIKNCRHNPEHFAPLYKKYHDEIFLFINKRIADIDTTADLTSKTFLQCLKYIDKFEFQGVPFSSWLYKIAINEVNQYFRKEANASRAVSIDDSHITSLVQEIDYSEISIDPYIMVSVLLEELNENEIQFIELRFFEHKSFKEMAYLLGMTEVNAKIKTYRILKKLRKLSKNIKYNE